MNVTLLPGVRKHPDGPGYQIRVSPFPPETRAMPDEANARAIQLRQYREAGIRDLRAVESTSETITLREACEGYRNAKLARGGKNGPLAPKTRTALTLRLRPWAEGPFADLPLAWLQRRAVEDAITARAAQAPRSARDEQRELVNVLAWAQGRGEAVPAALFGLPPVRVTTRPRQALTFAETEYLIAHAPAYGRDLLSFLVLCGGRVGEAFAAEPSWFALKDDTPTLTVPEWACKERREKVIVLTADDVALVRRQLLARAAGSRYVFPKREGSRWSYNSFHLLVWAKAVKRAAAAWRDEHGDGPTPFDGLRVHDLRATNATLMRDAGVPVEIAAARLGHKDGGFLLLTTYRKVTPAMQDAALRAALGGGLGSRAAGATEDPRATPNHVIPAAEGR